MRAIRRWALVIIVLGGASLVQPEIAAADGPCYVCGYETCPSQSQMEDACDFFCGGSNSATCGAGDFCGWHEGAPEGIACYSRVE